MAGLFSRRREDGSFIVGKTMVPLVLREKDSVPRGAMPVVPPGGTRAAHENAPAENGDAVNRFFTMRIELHRVTPRFGKPDLSRIVKTFSDPSDAALVATPSDAVSRSHLPKRGSTVVRIPCDIPPRSRHTVGQPMSELAAVPTA